MPLVALSDATPLILVSEFAQQAAFDATNATVSTRTLTLIKHMSGLLQAGCRRRFDERVASIKHTPTGLQYGGDLIEGRQLWLRSDLKTLTSMTNGDGQPMTIGTMKLLPDEHFAKQEIRLGVYDPQFFSASGAVDPVDSMAVTGTWGFGGQWVAVATVTNTPSIDAVITDLQTSVLLEAGMMLRVESEYMYIQAVSTTSGPTVYHATVDRGANGSTAAIHLLTVPIYRFRPLEIVTRLMVRLTSWANELVKNPLFGQAVIGDIILPFDTTTMPKDVVDAINKAGLRRMKRPSAVRGSTE